MLVVNLQRPTIFYYRLKYPTTIEREKKTRNKQIIHSNKIPRVNFFITLICATECVK